MRITQESDYALRILTALAEENELIDAGTLSERTSVPTRFALKILHKLVGGNFVSSYKGAHGGYKIKLKPEEITLGSVIELIDGPIVIARCLESGESCSYSGDKSSCIYHHIFESISLDVAKKLGRITIKDVLLHNFTLN